MARTKKGVPGSPDNNSDSELPTNAEPYGTAGHDVHDTQDTHDVHDIPDPFDEPPDGEYTTFRPYSEYVDDEDEEPDDQEPLRRQLAQFAFVREEDDREVRLYFRDVPAHEIARAFRGSGALLISMTGERALSLASAAAAANAQPGWTSTEIVQDTASAAPSRTRRKRNRRATGTDESDTSTSSHATGTSARPNRHLGELTMRYFFSLGERVYTVNIAAPTGLIESVASIFPVAAQSERELHTRLAVLFREVSDQ